MDWIDKLPPRPIVATFIVTCLAGWLFKGHCLTHGYWLASIQYTSGCYSDAVPFWGLRGVSAGLVPYFQVRLEYPVLTGLLIWIEGGMTRLLFGHAATAGHFLAVVTLVNAALAAGVLCMMWRAGVERWRLWLWSAAPPVILYLGHNWDMLAIAFAVAAFLLARSDRPIAAAAVAGLGVAAKLFPILILPLLGLGALFGKTDQPWRERLAQASLISMAAIGAWGIVNIIPALFAFTNWSEFYSFSTARSGTAASTWEVIQYLGWHSTDVDARNSQSFLVFIAGMTVILAAGWQTHRARLWLLFTPLLAWFLIANKVYSPQFDLWLYPFLILSCRRIWPVLLFALTDFLAYFAEFWMFAGWAGVHPSATMGTVALAASLRAVVLLIIIVRIARSPAPDWITSGSSVPLK